MELGVRKLISTSRQVDFISHNLIVTAEVLAFRSNSSGEIDDAIPLDEIESTEVVAKECRQEGGWNIIKGIIQGDLFAPLVPEKQMITATFLHTCMLTTSRCYSTYATQHSLHQ